MTTSPATEIDFEIHPSQTRVPAAERMRILADPGFGQVFTDHMITLRWSAERGWHDGKLEPYGPFALDPATSVFHYGQELFEGLKAYRQDSGSVVMFRPQANAARFNAGARRMAMPELPRGDVPARARAAGGAGQGVDTRRRGQQPLPAPVHDRDAARPRGQPPVVVVPVLRDRVAGAAPTSARPRRSRSGCRRTTPGRPPAAPARSSAAATTRPPSPPSSRRWTRAATRWCGWTRPSTSGSRRWAA